MIKQSQISEKDNTLNTHKNIISNRRSKKEKKKKKNWGKGGMKIKDNLENGKTNTSQKYKITFMAAYWPFPDLS